MARPWLGALFTICVFVAASSQAAIRIDADLDRHTEPIEGTKIVPPDQHRSLVVFLAERVIVIDDGDARTVYDFANRRQVQIDLKAKTRIDYSLYATPALRMFEWQNRSGIRRALAAAKMPPREGMSVIDDEHTLSIQDQRSSPLQVSTDATYRIFSDGNRTLFRETLHTTPLPPAEARRFAQFVCNMAAGHPQIIEHLGAANAVPDEWTMTTYLAGITTTTLHVLSVQAVDDVPMDVTGYAPRQTPAGGDAIDRILDRGMNMASSELDTERRLNTEATAKAFADGRTLDGFLSSLERALMTGETPTFTDPQRAAFGGDDATTRTRIALGARDKTTYAAAIESFVQLRAATTTNAHVLAIWEANDRRQLGDLQSGQKLFIEVLAKHPAIAGVYKDLGDTLLGSYDTLRAWRAFDAGRRIGPAFANFRAVDQLEQQIATKHPEYF